MGEILGRFCIFVNLIDISVKICYTVCWQTKRIREVRYLYKGFGLQIKHLNNLITKKTYALFANDEYPHISHSAFKVIDYLYQTQEKDVTQKDIEKALVINRATTSKMLLLLEQKGFISRNSSANDARTKTVKLTERGFSLREHNLSGADKLDRIFAEVLSEEDFEAFSRIYEKLRTALDE